MLEVKNVRKLYDNKNGIQKANFALKEGELCTLLGRNGSGKTTLLKCILGLCEIDDGEILFQEKPVNLQYEQVAFISADGSSMPYMKIKEYGKFLHQYYKSFDLEKYKQLCESMRLKTDTKISSLSKGEKMKVELAAGFAMQAKLILLDEPFTSLDIYAKEDAVKLLLDHIKEDTILLVSTHDIEEVESIADRCIVLNDGNVVEDFYVDTLHDSGRDLKTYLQKYRPE